MRFRPWLFWSLLAPVILLAIPYSFALLVMHGNPSSSLEDRGAGVLTVFAFLTCVWELVAVPVAFFQMVRHAHYRTLVNFIVAIIGLLPPAVLAFLMIVLLYGHG